MAARRPEPRTARERSRRTRRSSARRRRGRAGDRDGERKDVAGDDYWHRDQNRAQIVAPRIFNFRRYDAQVFPSAEIPDDHRQSCSQRGPRVCAERGGVGIVKWIRSGGRRSQYRERRDENRGGSIDHHPDGLTPRKFVAPRPDQRRCRTHTAQRPVAGCEREGSPTKIRINGHVDDNVWNYHDLRRKPAEVRRFLQPGSEAGLHRIGAVAQAAIGHRQAGVAALPGIAEHQHSPAIRTTSWGPYSPPLTSRYITHTSGIRPSLRGKCVVDADMAAGWWYGIQISVVEIRR